MAWRPSLPVGPLFRSPLPRCATQRQCPRPGRRSCSTELATTGAVGVPGTDADRACCTGQARRCRRRRRSHRRCRSPIRVRLWRTPMRHPRPRSFRLSRRERSAPPRAWRCGQPDVAVRRSRRIHAAQRSESAGGHGISTNAGAPGPPLPARARRAWQRRFRAGRNRRRDGPGVVDLIPAADRDGLMEVLRGRGDRHRAAHRRDRFAAVRVPPVVITTLPSARAPCMVIVAVAAGADIVSDATPRSLGLNRRPQPERTC